EQGLRRAENVLSGDSTANTNDRIDFDLGFQVLQFFIGNSPAKNESVVLHGFSFHTPRHQVNHDRPQLITLRLAGRESTWTDNANQGALATIRELLIKLILQLCYALQFVHLLSKVRYASRIYSSHSKES